MKRAVKAKPMLWRVGAELGRTIYSGDMFLGIMDDPKVAAYIVSIVNLVHACLAKPKRKAKGK